jgi:branched-subunit amino acid transport protein
MSGWLSNFVGDWRLYLPLVLLGFLPNEMWRLIGWWVGARIDEGTEIFIWVRLVSTAIMAAVIGQLLIAPPGQLAEVPELIRYGAVAAGLLVFLGLGRSMLLAVIVGEIVLIVGRYFTVA